MASSASDPLAQSDPTAQPAPDHPPDPSQATHQPTRRPVVGLTTYLQDAAWGVWNTRAALLPAEYVSMVVSAGATPVLLPPHGTDTQVLDLLDGLILTGGADVGPERYGAEPHVRTQSQPWRDEHEFTLLAAARDLGLPVLGICRGLQVINAAAGGTLHQHVPEVVGTDAYQPAPGEYGEVVARTVPGTRIAAIVGEDVTAPCYHHQSVDRVGDGLTVTAQADDGTIEVLEGAEQDPWLLAVQWHPEHNPVDIRVLQAFVTQAQAHAEAAAGSAPEAAAGAPSVTPASAPSSSTFPEGARP